MKTKIISILLVLLTITSCSGSGKVASMIEFTNKLAPDSDKQVILGDLYEVGDFGNQLDLVNNNGIRINVENLHKNQKFRQKKLTNSNLAAYPSVANGNIYTIDYSANVQSLDIETGNINWSIKLGLPKQKITKATLTYHNDKLYVTADLNLYVFNADNGREIYKAPLDNLVKNYPLIISNAFVLQDVANQIKMYNTETWMPQWVYRTWQDDITTKAVISPVYSNGQLITVFSTGEIFSFDIKNGNQLWQRSMLRDLDDSMLYVPSDLSHTPIVSNNALYLASNNDYLEKINLNDASISWSRKVEDVISMNLSGNTLFVTNNARQLAAISDDDGSVIWVKDLISPDKMNKKRDNLNLANFTTPIISKDSIYIFSSIGDGFKFSAYTGDLLDYYRIPKGVTSLAIYNNKIILFTQNSAYFLD